MNTNKWIYKIGIIRNGRNHYEIGCSLELILYNRNYFK